MDIKYLAGRFDSALYGICPGLRCVLEKLPEKIKAQTQEVRIRANKPVMLTTYNEQLFVKKTGDISYLPGQSALYATSQDVAECFTRLCNFSVHTHHEEIKQGFIIMKGGHRAGVCGTVVAEGQNIFSQRQINSINIRIAKEIRGCASGITHLHKQGGILLAGGPGSGKTTVLRDLIRQLSSGEGGSFLKVAVIDTRGELAAVYGGEAQNDIGLCTDIITGCPKPQGIQMALRTMSPDIIAFDEIGTLEEVEAVEESLNSGATIITSIHAGSLKELIMRKQARRLFQSGAISNVVMLSKPVGSPMKIYNLEEVYAEISRSNRAGGGLYGGRGAQVI